MINFFNRSDINRSMFLKITALSLFCTAAIANNSTKIEPISLTTNMQEIGKQIYLTGHTPSGEVIQAVVGNDAPISGDQFSCVSCHRRSRLGSSEGGKQVPALTATALFKPAQVSVTRGVLPKAFKHTGSTRIPYTDETLAKVIREGVDPSGRKLDPLMPRYAMDEKNIAALNAYLKTEPVSKIPGVDDTTLHFATIVTEGVDPVKRKAMLDILIGYFQDKNADTRHNTKRAKFSAYKMYQVYRKWELHVWELNGKESSWPAQLERYYKKQPILAMVGGLSVSGWQPMHQFCEQFEIACLFPNTDVPVISENDFYTTYFSKGLSLEAETLANHLQNENTKVKNRPITQVFRDTGQARIAAKALNKILQKNDNFQLQDVVIPGSQVLSPAFWDDLFKKMNAGALVLWLDKADLESLGNSQQFPSAITAVYGSISLVDEKIPKLTDVIRERLYLIYPWALPNARDSQLIRVKTWLKSKHLSFEQERLQANTFFAVQVLSEVIMHLLDNFSSAYIIERVEGMLSSFSSISIYPHLSLGAGQKFASKGGYIVKISPDGHLSSVQDWIVP
ncbi:MAG: hypothetical protein ABL903_14550 [Methylococcales bacterium]